VNHQFLQTLDVIVLYATFLGVAPGLIVVFTDRFRQQPSPKEYGVLFAVIVGIGVLLSLPAISIVAAVGLLVLGLARLSARYALSGTSYERELTPARLFPGDRARLMLRFANDKLLPLSWVVITDPIRHGLVRPGGALDEYIRFSGGVEVQDNLGQGLVNRTAVGPFQSVIREYEVEGLKRGVYTMEPARVVTGDLFGVFHRETEMGSPLDIVVYPKIYSPDEIPLPLRRAIGEMVVRRVLHEDPALIAGSREYQPGDPLNRMHWKSTARTMRLQVKRHDASTTAQIMIALNLNTYLHVWQGIDLERMEAAIELAGSLAVWALERGFAVGLRTNGIIAGAEAMSRIAPSASPRQPGAVLEHLARIAFSGRHSAQTVLVDESRYLSSGSTIVFVTPIITPDIIQVLTSRALKDRIAVVYCGRYAAPVIRGVPVHLVSPPERARRAAS